MSPSNSVEFEPENEIDASSDESDSSDQSDVLAYDLLKSSVSGNSGTPSIWRSLKAPGVWP